MHVTFMHNTIYCHFIFLLWSTCSYLSVCLFHPTGADLVKEAVGFFEQIIKKHYGNVSVN